MGAGKTIGGVILIFLAIIFFGISIWISNIQSDNIKYCNSLMGNLGQGLDSETAEICQNAPTYKTIAELGRILGGILLVFGFVLIIISAIPKKQNMIKDVSTQIDTEVNPSSVNDHNLGSNSNERMYCRYCGKSRPIEGEFCSIPISLCFLITNFSKQIVSHI